MTSARALAPADPAWPQLEKELLANPEITVLPIVPAAGRESLHRLQVTTRSRMGALALHTGGLLVDHGWLRVLGGRFEVNGPEPATVGRPGRPGEVCYFGRTTTCPPPHAALRPSASCSRSRTSSAPASLQNRTRAPCTSGPTERSSGDAAAYPPPLRCSGPPWSGRCGESARSFADHSYFVRATR